MGDRVEVPARLVELRGQGRQELLVAVDELVSCRLDGLLTRSPLDGAEHRVGGVQDALGGVRAERERLLVCDPYRLVVDDDLEAFFFHPATPLSAMESISQSWENARNAEERILQTACLTLAR